MMMSHPAPRRDSPSTAALEDVRKVISFQEPKRAWVWVDLGQSRMAESSPLWMGLSNCGPKSTASGTFFPCTPALRTGDCQRPSQVLRDPRKQWSSFHPPRDITATNPESPMPTQLCLATKWPWTGIYTPPSVSRFHLSLSGPAAGPNGSRPEQYVPVVLRVWSPALHEGTCEKYRFSGPTLKLLNQISGGGAQQSAAYQASRWFQCS